MKSTKKVAIVGAGVSGTCMAHFLKKTGIHFTIFEKSAVLRDTGLGFLIMGNGLRILDSMGLKDVVCSSGNMINHYYSINHQNEITKENDIDGCLAISRENFIKSIRINEIDEKIILNSQLKTVHFDSRNNQSIIEFMDGSSESFDLVIGADGIHSQLRDLISPNQKKPVAGYKEIVGKINDATIFNECGQSFFKLHNKEKGFNMGVLASHDNNVIWFLQFDTSKNNVADAEKISLQNFVLDMTKDAPAFFRTIIENYNAEDAYLWNLVDVDIADSFTKEGLVLIGDAAHPLLSFTSQGVNSALEDAQLLTELILESNKNNTTLNSDKFNEVRRNSILTYINEGRELMNRFLNPEIYQNEKEPFIQPV